MALTVADVHVVAPLTIEVHSELFSAVLQKGFTRLSLLVSLRLPLLKGKTMAMEMAKMATEKREIVSAISYNLMHESFMKLMMGVNKP